MGAGSGTRMFPLTHFINKHLLHLGGKPVIRIIADKILSAHLHPEDITIICNTKDLKDYQWEFRDLQVNFYDFPDSVSGTARQAYDVIKKLLEQQEEDVLIHYGDTITDLDYSDYLSYWWKLRDVTAGGLLAVTKNIRHDYSQVTIHDGLVTKMEEKPLLLQPSWTGIGIFNVGYLALYMNEVMKESDTDFAYDIFPQMQKYGLLHAYEYDGRWFDVGNLRSYRLLFEEFRNKELNL